jgi:DNA-binding PadR family transcriptional regulator
MHSRGWPSAECRINGKENADVSEKPNNHRALGLVQVAIMNVITSQPLRSYGTAIADQVSKLVGRDLTDAQVYVALHRLEEQGLISSRVDDVPLPSKKSRGRPRKYYASTAKGRRALESAGAYTSSKGPFMQSTFGGDYEGEAKGPMPTPVVV